MITSFPAAVAAEITAGVFETLIASKEEKLDANYTAYKSGTITADYKDARTQVSENINNCGKVSADSDGDGIVGYMDPDEIIIISPDDRIEVTTESIDFSMIAKSSNIISLYNLIISRNSDITNHVIDKRGLQLLGTAWKWTWRYQFRCIYPGIG